MSVVSIFISKHFLSLLMIIINSSIFEETGLLGVTKRWHLSALIFVWFSSNHLKSLQMLVSNFFITSLVHCGIAYCRLQSLRWYSQYHQMQRTKVINAFLKLLFSNFTEVAWSLLTRLDHKTWSSTSVGFEQGTFQIWM